MREFESMSLPENEGLNEWPRKKEIMVIVVFQYMLLGNTLSVPVHNNFLSGYLKKLILKCIGAAAAGSLCGALKISRAWWLFLYHRRESPMVQHEDHNNIFVHLRHGGTLRISVSFEEKRSQQQTEQVSDMHTGVTFSKSHFKTETPFTNFHKASLINTKYEFFTNVIWWNEKFLIKCVFSYTLVKPR